jgi:hypothetical protein
MPLIVSLILYNKMSETRSRSRSRSPGRDGNNAPADNSAPPADDYNGGGAEEEVKLYVGNLDYGKFFRLWNRNENRRTTENKIPFFNSNSNTPYH